MKTLPFEKEYHDIEMQDDSVSEKKIPPGLDNLKNVGKKNDQGFNKNISGIECQHSSESDTLIICNPELAASFQSPKVEKHKLNPGHYLQKVFLNSVAQKFRSQSLPSCLEKKKFQKSTLTDAIDELNETSVPLVGDTDKLTDLVNLDVKESLTENWFKTWPERGVDKLLVRKEDTNCDNEPQSKPNSIGCDQVSVDSTLTATESGNDTQSEPHGVDLENGNDSNIGDEICSFSQESHLDLRLCLKNGLTRQPDRLKSSRSESICANVHVSGPKQQEGSKAIPLDELLDNFPLAYSPVTRQLLLISSKTEKLENSSGFSTTCTQPKVTPRSEAEENLNLEETAIDKVGSGRGSGDNPRCSECDLSGSHFHLTNTELSSFSSTVSSLSDNSPSTNEDSALGSLLDHGDTCSLVSIGGCSAFSEDSVGGKTKKKSLTGFFSRNVFNWKSGSRSEDSIARSGAGWKIFGKNSSPQSSHTSLTVDAEWDGGSLAPDSPRSVHSTSSGPRTFSHESRVASSSALIQLDRPANLPAKSEEEEARHRQEYLQMVEAARKKELKEAKHRKKQLQLQLRAEELSAQATRAWTQEILPRWDQMHKSKKCRELWWQGVPPCVRGRVWQLAIGNPLNLTHSLYDICVQRAQDRLQSGEASCSDEDDSDNKEASMQLIQLDISRTFPHLCIFQKGGPYYDMLHCLLAAYVCYRPDVGYVQGMSFIAAVLILNMEAADAFVCFANLLNRSCHMAFFHLNQPLMQAYYSTYNELFKENLPQLFNHFTSTSLSPDLYLLEWIYTVFSKAMSLDLASRVWDVFLRDGEHFLFRAALGVLHLCQENLLQMDFVRGSQFLTKLPDDLSADQLFKSISCIKMTVGKQTFEDILAVNSADCH